MIYIHLGEWRLEKKHQGKRRNRGVWVQLKSSFYICLTEVHGEGESTSFWPQGDEDLAEEINRT